jgi:fermentation-respiration switch protein FrsA (DUF1100 family)
MGAATVLMASGLVMPRKVVGILADCGYTSAKGIICEVIKQLHLPPVVLYPFVRLGARIYGGFSLEERSPVEAVVHSRVTVIFYHGDTDTLVPHAMSMANHQACASAKKLILTPGAGHGLCFLKDKNGYLRELLAFCKENGIPAEDRGLEEL